MPHHITQITPHLWIYQSSLFLTNAGLFVSEDQGVLIDPCIYPQEIEAWRYFAAANLLHLSHLILTHHHWDHILGPEHYPILPIITQTDYVTATGGEHTARLQDYMTYWFAKEKMERDEPFVVPQPTYTFTDRMTLRVGEETLQLVHAPGHAPDQLVIYHPLSHLLWSSDILSDVEIPFVSHNLAAYERTLAMLAEWEIEVLVPGHGHVTASRPQVEQRIHEDREYLGELRGRVTHALAQGQTIAETVALCADMAYRNREENAKPHQRNVESVYLELGGQSEEKNVGWGQFD